MLPSQPILCAPDFDFPALLERAMHNESQTISSYPEIGLPDASADSMLHDNSLAPPFRCTPSPSIRASPQQGTSSLNPPCKRKADAKPLSDSHRRRKRHRQEKLAALGQFPRPEIEATYVDNAVPIETSVDVAAFPSTVGAYSAKPSGKISGAQVKHRIEDLLRRGFTYVNWDGRADRPIVDRNRTVVGVLVGMPDDPGFLRAAKAAFTHILEEGRCAQFSLSERKHCRGAFPAINVGITHGKGTLEPVRLNNHQHKPMVNRLLADPNINRLATFASSSFSMWAPNVYRYYKDRLDKLYKKNTDLHPNFQHSVYPSAAFNFGPQVCTFKHRDVLNCPFGWCAIQALGDFDAKKGGHLVLWELKLIVEFPAGSLILIPSSTITHSNISIPEGDTRISFTQYASGGLFRYVDYGFRTEKALINEDPALYAKMSQLRPDMWKMGLGLIRTLQPLASGVE